MSFTKNTKEKVKHEYFCQGSCGGLFIERAVQPEEKGVTTFITPKLKLKLNGNFPCARGHGVIFKSNLHSAISE